MTTSRSSLALALALASPAAAQELALPSGHAARLYDVVLEDAGVMAPDAFTDPEGGEEGAPEEEPLDAEPEEAPEAALGGVARFRLVVEGLGGEGAAWEDVQGDFAWVCEQVALPALAANEFDAAEVSVSFGDREVAFGFADPDAVQFFEGFRVEEGACVPQAY